jgi:DNA polymerase elongation subunit (family B)
MKETDLFKIINLDFTSLYSNIPRKFFNSPSLYRKNKCAKILNKIKDGRVK